MHKSDNIRSSSANYRNLRQTRSNVMDTSMNSNKKRSTKDQMKSNDVKSDINSDDVTHANDLLNSPNFLRIPLKPIEHRQNDDLINEKRFVYLHFPL